jgi:hypothetical protein
MAIKTEWRINPDPCGASFDRRADERDCPLSNRIETVSPCPDHLIPDGYKLTRGFGINPLGLLGDF